ncbi:MAG: hypothetical protein ACD_20C00184G0002 [uncultured bacterium]|nr:MAG: hypothetical protein ACD_20C00184G0002 [uncultured bacterium]
MNIKIIDNEQEFLKLKDDWNRLSSGLITVNNFNWAYSWWKHHKKSDKLQIIVARLNNKVVGIAPLYLKHMSVFKYLKFTKLCFLGGDLSDYLDFLIQQDSNRESIFTSLLGHSLNNISYDYLGLGQINSNYTNIDLWEKYSKSLNLKFKSYRECHKINLAEFKSADDYINNLSKNLKKDIRRIQNKIERDFDKVEYVFKKDITEKDIEIIANMNIKRQKDLIEKGVNDRFCYFIEKEKANFIKDYFCNGDSGSKMIVYLKCNDIPIAYDMVLQNYNSISFWNGTIDPDYEKYSPTKLLMIEFIKYAFENDITIIDFLRGDDPYKLQWTNDFSLNYNLTKTKSLKARLAYLYKECLPESMLQKLKSTDIRVLLDEGYQE